MNRPQSDFARVYIALRYGADLKGPEIAELTGLTLANVQQIVSRSCASSGSCWIGLAPRYSDPVASSAASRIRASPLLKQAATTVASAAGRGP
jgi:hypothetical protein